MEEQMVIETGAAAAVGGVMLIFIAINFVLAILGIIAQWKILTKAGQPGWAMFVPIYNLIVYCRVIGKPDWWWLLGIIPIYGWFVVPIIATVRLAKAFGKDIGFALGLIFLAPIFILILGFGSSQYVGFNDAVNA